MWGLGHRVPGGTFLEPATEEAGHERVDGYNVFLAVDECDAPGCAESMQSMRIRPVRSGRQVSHRSLDELLGCEALDSVDDDRSAIGVGAILCGAVQRAVHQEERPCRTR